MVKFSFLIPVYNTGSLMTRCMESVLAQTYDNYEVIIVDDGSTDGSGDLCDTYLNKSSKVKVLHQKNKKLYAARMNASLYATGDYIIFVDSDDFVEKDMLYSLNEFLSNHQCDVVFFNTNVVNIDDKIIGKRNFELQSGQSVDKKELVKYMIHGDRFNSIWIKCVSREKFCPSKKFVGMNMSEDVVNTVQILKESEKIYYLDRELYNYRINDNSITHNIKIEHLLQSNIAKDELFSYIKILFGNNSSETIEYQKRYIKGLLWYTQKIRNGIMYQTPDMLARLKDSNIYQSCLQNDKLPFVYCWFIKLFDNNNFLLLEWIVNFFCKVSRREIT